MVNAVDIMRMDGQWNTDEEAWDFGHLWDVKSKGIQNCLKAMEIIQCIEYFQHKQGPWLKTPEST